jgi:transporter family-2 protein
MVVDRTGVGGEVRPVGAVRVYAAVIAIAAVVVAQLGRPVGEFAPGLVAFVVVAGAASAFQAGFNGRIANAVRDPYAPTAVNVFVGAVALVVIVAGLLAAGQVDTVHWPSEPWLYIGGVLGATIVLALAVASAAVGVLRATLAMLAAQLSSAFLVDWIVQGDAPRYGAVIGAAMIVVSVVLVGRSRAT